MPRESQEMPLGQRHPLYRERLKLTQRKFHLHVWGEDSGTNSSWFPLSPPCASKVFICPLLTGKQVWKGQSLPHPASSCCSSRLLTVLVGSMLGVRVGSPLPWLIPASLLAELQASQLWVPPHHIPQLPVSPATGQHYTPEHRSLD